MSETTIKEKYKAGKQNYQQRLKVEMNEAANILTMQKLSQEKRRLAFNLMTWKTYNLLSTTQDRKEIDSEIKDRLDDEKVTHLRSMKHFRNYVNSNPYHTDLHKFKNKHHTKYWFEIYRIMREALAYRYAGRKTTVTEENMQEGLDEGPDHFDDGMEEENILEKVGMG